MIVVAAAALFLAWYGTPQLQEHAPIAVVVVDGVVLPLSAVVSPGVVPEPVVVQVGTVNVSGNTDVEPVVVVEDVEVGMVAAQPACLVRDAVGLRAVVTKVWCSCA